MKAFHAPLPPRPHAEDPKGWREYMGGVAGSGRDAKAIFRAIRLETGGTRRVLRNRVTDRVLGFQLTTPSGARVIYRM